MTGNADYSVHGPGGVEITGPVPISHTVDERKNRNQTPKRRKRRRPPARRDQLPAEEPEEDARQDLGEDDETKPTVDFLA